MASQLSSFSIRQTPQSQPADPAQTRNAAGGYAFEVDLPERVLRFLCLGTERPTYYASAPELTRENAQAVVQMARTDHSRLVDLILQVSLEGRAPKVDPTLFALAIACSVGTDADRAWACSIISTVCRTVDHLAGFLTYVQAQRGWGRALKTGVRRWFLDRSPEQIAYQAVKYRQRRGWTLADVIRLAHVDVRGGDTPLSTQAQADLSDVLAWVRASQRHTTGAITNVDRLPRIARVSEALRAAPVNQVPDVLREVADVAPTWEMLPSEALTDPQVWEALLELGMPLGALVRQLPRLTRLGVLDRPAHLAMVTERLSDPLGVAQARLHPMNLLVAHLTYAHGRGAGRSTWMPRPEIIDALEDAYDLAFASASPIDRRLLVALDVSGSMDAQVLPGVSARQASAALALTLARLAQTHGTPTPEFVAFSAGRNVPPLHVMTDSFARAGYGTMAVSAFGLSARQRLDDVVHSMERLPFGGTDCALPMLYARRAKREVDGFVILTDNETWAGAVHPHEALDAYRAASGIPARCAVVALSSSAHTVARPGDAHMMDFVGFDSAMPAVLAEWLTGAL